MFKKLMNGLAELDEWNREQERKYKPHIEDRQIKLKTKESIPDIATTAFEDVKTGRGFCIDCDYAKIQFLSYEYEEIEGSQIESIGKSSLYLPMGKLEVIWIYADKKYFFIYDRKDIFDKLKESIYKENVEVLSVLSGMTEETNRWLKCFMSCCANDVLEEYGITEKDLIDSIIKETFEIVFGGVISEAEYYSLQNKREEKKQKLYKWLELENSYDRSDNYFWAEDVDIDSCYVQLYYLLPQNRDKYYDAYNKKLYDQAKEDYIEFCGISFEKEYEALENYRYYLQEKFPENGVCENTNHCLDLLSRYIDIWKEEQEALQNNIDYFIKIKDREYIDAEYNKKISRFLEKEYHILNKVFERIFQNILESLTDDKLWNKRWFLENKDMKERVGTLYNEYKTYYQMILNIVEKLEKSSYKEKIEEYLNYTMYACVILEKQLGNRESLFKQEKEINYQNYQL